MPRLNRHFQQFLYFFLTFLNTLYPPGLELPSITRLTLLQEYIYCCIGNDLSSNSTTHLHAPLFWKELCGSLV